MSVPDTPRAKQRDNPRPFFRFYPLVSRKDDVYKKVLDTAKEMAREGVVVRGVPVTDELYDIYFSRIRLCDLSYPNSTRSSTTM